MTARDGWADAPDAEHPIRWQDAAGAETAWMTAVLRRLIVAIPAYAALVAYYYF